MATFLDISLLGHFTSIFTFLLVFVIVYGLLEVFAIFGQERRSLNAIIAVMIAFIVVLSSNMVRVIETFTPWFALIVLTIFFILFAVRMFGLKTEQITQGFYNNPSITTWIIILTAVALLFSLGSGFGQTTLEQGKGNTTVNATGTSGSTATNSFSQNLYNTLYHPKILGMILVMLIVVVAMLFLTSKEGP